MLEGETTFLLVYMQNFGRGDYQVEKEKRKNCLPLAVERPAAVMFVPFCS